MKIGIDITPIIYEGTGIGDYTFHLVENLLKQNPEDEFMLFYSTLRGFGKIKEKIEELMKGNQGNKWDKGNRGTKNYKIVGLPLPPAFWQIVWNKLGLIKIETFTGPLDVFHCWDYLIPPPNCKRVVTIHDATPLLFPETHRQKIISNYKLIIAKIIKEKIQVITDSENSKKDLISFGVDSNLINVIYVGNNFSVDEKKIEYQKENYILAVGTRQPRKNLKRVIEVFTSIADEYPDLELRIAGKYGWGEDDESTNKQINKYKNRIKILGYINDNDLVKLYRQAMCLVYPSLYEGFGLPILEAMSLGCPVITSNVSSMPEVGGDAVLYVNPKSVEEIKSSIIRIIESKDLQNELINKGLKQAKKFSWAKTANETKQVYKNVTV